jgi:hypothetical protein
LIFNLFALWYDKCRESKDRKKKVKKGSYGSEVMRWTFKEGGSMSEGAEEPKTIVHEVLPRPGVNAMPREEKQEGTPRRKEARS